MDTRPEAKAKHPKNPRARPRTGPSEDRSTQGQECSRLSTKDTTLKYFCKKKVFAKTKSRSFRKIQAISKQKRSSKVFARSLACFLTKQNWSWSWPIFNKSKYSAVLEPRTGHFRGLAGFEAKNFTFEGQGPQIVSSKTSSETKDVLEDSTSNPRHSPFCSTSSPLYFGVMIG